MSPQTMMRFAIPAYMVGLALLVAVALAGDVVNGARRWLHVGVTRFQPSEMMKLALPLMLAWYFHKQRGDAAAARLFRRRVPARSFRVGLILRQPDLGTAGLVGAAGFYIIFFAGISWRVIGALGRRRRCSAAAAVAFPARLPAPAAILTLLDPSQRSARGRLPHHPVDDRRGLGRPRRQGLAERHAVAPRVHPRAAYRFHLRRVLRGVRPDRQHRCCSCSTPLLIARGLMIAANAATLFARLLAGAITLMFFIYAFVNMGMVSGILPVVGVPLPFHFLRRHRAPHPVHRRRHPDEHPAPPAARPDLVSHSSKI